VIYPTTDYYKAHEVYEKDDSSTRTHFLDLVDWMTRYGFDGGDNGEIVVTGSLSYMGFFNHACENLNQSSSVMSLEQNYRGILRGSWDPVTSRYRIELHHAEYFARDIAAGEMIVDDYTRWEQVHFGVSTDELASWCGLAE
jgi:hypothetical protein